MQAYYKCKTGSKMNIHYKKINPITHNKTFKDEDTLKKFIQIIMIIKK